VVRALVRAVELGSLLPTYLLVQCCYQNDVIKYVVMVSGRFTKLKSRKAAKVVFNAGLLSISRAYLFHNLINLGLSLYCILFSEDTVRYQDWKCVNLQGFHLAIMTK